MKHLTTIIALLFSLPSFGQNANSNQAGEDPRTILWKITGNDIKKPSYLLGTMHLMEMDWLLSFPEIKAVVDSTEYILNEAFSTELKMPMTTKRPGDLTALSLLTPAQYQTVDSFFIARVGEGIRANPDAEEMSVAEMQSAILQTLVMDRPGANGITRFMDLDLFNLYKARGDGGDHLDKLKNYDFDSTRVTDARLVMKQIIGRIAGSDKPEWNIYSDQDQVEEVIRRYRQMDLPYYLDKTDSTYVKQDVEYGYVTIQERNRNWLPKIEKNIAQRSCLIAVGFAHLRYTTGVIVLLRELGYTLEPVSIVR
jgi:uncharacterized protein YbaP (TraB family)